MKFFGVFAVINAVLLQTAFSQCLPQTLLSGPIVSAGPGTIIQGPGPCLSPYGPSVQYSPCGQPIQYVASDSVANNLADTLSLLTVSSLLAETLPYGPQVALANGPVVTSVPYASGVVAGYPGCGSCGNFGACGCGNLGACGCGNLGACGCGNYGVPFGSFVI